MREYYIGLDNGGTFIKAGLFDETGALKAMVKEASVAAISGEGRVEIDQERCCVVSRDYAQRFSCPERIKHL